MLKRYAWAGEGVNLGRLVRSAQDTFERLRLRKYRQSTRFVGSRESCLPATSWPSSQVAIASDHQFLPRAQLGELSVLIGSVLFYNMRATQ